MTSEVDDVSSFPKDRCYFRVQKQKQNMGVKISKCYGGFRRRPDGDDDYSYSDAVHSEFDISVQPIQGDVPSSPREQTDSIPKSPRLSLFNMVKSSKRSVSNFLRSPKPSRSGFHFRSARESSVESQFLSSSEDQTSPQESSSRLEPSPANASPDDLRRFPRQLLSDTMQWTSPRQTSPMTSPNLPSSNSDRPSSPRSPLPSHSDQISSSRDSQRIRSPIERDSRSPPASNYRPPPSDMGTPAVTTSPDQSRPSAGTSGGSLVEDELSGIHSRHCIHSSYGLTIVSEETSPESKLQASCGSSRQGSPVPHMGSTSEGSSAENETAKSQPSFQGQTSLRPQADKSDNKLPSSKVKLGQSGLFQKPDVDQKASSPTRLSVENRTPIPYRQPTPADSNPQTVANAGHTPSTQRRATSGVRHSSLTLSPSISPSFSPVISPLVSPRQSLTSLTPGSQGLFCGLTQPIPWAQSRSGAQSGPSEQSTLWAQPGRRFLMPPMTRRASAGQERTTHADTGRRWSSASGRSVDSCREQDTSEESGPKEDAPKGIFKKSRFKINKNVSFGCVYVKQFR